MRGERLTRRLYYIFHGYSHKKSYKKYASLEKKKNTTYINVYGIRQKEEIDENTTTGQIDSTISFT